MHNLQVELVKEHIMEWKEECARHEAELIGQKQTCVQKLPEQQQVADNSFLRVGVLKLVVALGGGRWGASSWGSRRRVREEHRAVGRGGALGRRLRPRPLAGRSLVGSAGVISCLHTLFEIAIHSCVSSISWGF